MNEIKIGTKYKGRGKFAKIWIVKDIWTTTNAKGELVKTRYVASHTFLGQEVFDYDVLPITIQRSIYENGELK